MGSASSLLESQGKKAVYEMLTNICDEAERRFEACPVQSDFEGPAFISRACARFQYDTKRARGALACQNENYRLSGKSSRYDFNIIYG